MTRFFGRPLRAAGSLLVLFVLVPLVVALVVERGGWARVAAFAVVSAALVLLAEVAFRLGYRLVFGGPYAPPSRLPFAEMYIEPHPYIPFVYKRHAVAQKGGPALYPLNRGRFTILQHSSNDLGFVNGLAGDRDVAVPKPAGLYRVACIGASAAGICIGDEDGSTVSVPLALEQALADRVDGPVEVNNCAQGGYNSADILVRFALQVLDTQPDAVVIYHAYNDIPAYYTRDFRSDYSHARRNLGDVYWKYKLSDRLPRPPLRSLNYLVDQWLPVNIRFSLLGQVGKGVVDWTGDPEEGLATYARNLRYVVQLCRANGVDVVVSTYCHYVYDGIADDAEQLLRHELVARENDVMRRLADELDLPLVDNAALVPDDERYFLDAVHFTPDGMRLVGRNLAEALVPLVSGVCA